MQKEADRPVLASEQAEQRPVFAASSGRRQLLVRLTSRLLALGMLALVTLILATTFSSVHDSVPSWPVITVQSK